MGYTTEEPVPAINITWDGNTEGRECVAYSYYKVSNNIFTIKELIGCMLSYKQSEYSSFEITAETIGRSSEADFSIVDPNLKAGVVYVALSDIEDYDMPIHKGIYFLAEDGIFVSSLTKEASTQEVVHQIDEKYIPSSGGAMVVTFELDEDGNVSADKTVAEVVEAMASTPIIGRFVDPASFYGYSALGSPIYSGSLPCFIIAQQRSNSTEIIPFIICAGTGIEDSHWELST